MEHPLRLKWLGEQTEEICSLLGLYHPLILVSPTPRPRSTEAGLISLPTAFSRAWDVRPQETGRGLPEVDSGAGQGVQFEHLEAAGGARVSAAVHECYFKVYLKSIAVRGLRGVPSYVYIEELNQRLLSREFAVFIRATLGGEVVAGCLLRRASAGQTEDYAGLLDGPRAGDETDGAADVLFFDMMAFDGRFADGELARLTFSHAASWAQRNGYALLSTSPMPAIGVVSDTFDAAWAFGGAALPVLHRRGGALLYCDLTRCCYLPQDVYYFADEQPTPCLYYFANVSGEQSQAVSMLNSITGVRKHVYTRQPRLRQAVSQAGVDCTLLR